MSTFRFGVLKWDVNAVAAAMILTPEEVREYFTDGRRVSFILERRLAREVVRGVLASSEGAGFDILDPGSGKWEVRSISRGGVYFCPSYMVGSGRTFDAGGFLAKLDEIQGYILSDIDLFPEIPWWLVPVEVVRAWWNTGRLGSATRISRDQALALLRESV